MSTSHKTPDRSPHGWGTRSPHGWRGVTYPPTGKVYKFSGSTGELLGVFGVGHILNSIDCHEGSVYVGGSAYDGKTLWCLDSSTGSNTWSIDTGGTVSSLRSRVSLTVFAVGYIKKYTLNGTLEWSYPIGLSSGRIDESVNGHVAFVGSATVYMLSSGGSLAWTFNPFPSGGGVGTSFTASTVCVASDGSIRVEGSCLYLGVSNYSFLGLANPSGVGTGQVLVYSGVYSRSRIDDADIGYVARSSTLASNNTSIGGGSGSPSYAAIEAFYPVASLTLPGIHGGVSYRNGDLYALRIPVTAGCLWSRYTNNGGSLDLVASGTSQTALPIPHDIAVDGDGNVWVI